MTKSPWCITTGRIWSAPEPTFTGPEPMDTPIFYELFYRHYPVRWMLGTETEGML